MDKLMTNSDNLELNNSYWPQLFLACLFFIKQLQIMSLTPVIPYWADIHKNAFYTIDIPELPTRQILSPPSS
jgi:hypothetical protein